MKPTVADIAKAAVESAFEALKAHGLESERTALARALAAEAKAQGGSLTARIITPDGKSGAVKAALEVQLRQKFGVPVPVLDEADPGILGGAIIEYGDERIDMSLRGELEAAAQQLRQS